MPITIHDVARLAKTSTATVSQSYNCPQRVAAETRRRVLAAARKLKYYPNLHARNLASQHSRTLGIIVSDIRNPFFPAVIRAFEERARHWGYEVVVSDTNYKPRLMKRAAERMLEQNVRGVAVMTSEMSAGLLREIMDREIAVTFFDLDAVSARVSTIKFNYSAGIYQVVEHLYQLGHRRIAFVGGHPLKSIKARETAYIESMRKFGLKPGPVMPGNQSIESGFSAGLKIAKLPERPTAVVAMNDLTAFGVIRALSQSGLRVPQDVSVVGFDRTFLAQYFVPSLTTVDIHPDHIGRLAVDCLHKLSTSEKPRGEEHLVDLQLIVGESTGPAPSFPRETSPSVIDAKTDDLDIAAASALQIVTESAR
jgi:LacI family transcriptional regulator